MKRSSMWWPTTSESVRVVTPAIERAEFRRKVRLILWSVVIIVGTIVGLVAQ